MAMAPQEHPFLHPLWRRIALVAFCAVWAAWEIYNGDQFWSTITVGMTLYGAYMYLYAYKVPGPKE